MPRIAPPEMVDLTLGGSLRFAKCWRISYGSKVIRLTDHDLPLSLVEDDGSLQLYKPMIDGSATETTDSFSGDNTTIGSVISSELITELDIRQGLVEGADVIERKVDHRYPWAGDFRRTTYKIGQIKYNPKVKAFEAEIMSKLNQLGRKVGSRYSRRCEAILGDPRTCGVDLTDFNATFTVSEVNADGTFVATPSRNNFNGFFNDGSLSWTAGDNNGFSSVVKSYSLQGEVWELQIPPERPIKVNDTATVNPGCNRLSGVNPDGSTNLVGDCINKFDNIIRFRGFPNMPTNDRLFETPDASI